MRSTVWLDTAVQAAADLFPGVTWAANSGEPGKVIELAGHWSKCMDGVEASLDELAQRCEAKQDATPIAFGGPAGDAAFWLTLESRFARSLALLGAEC